MTKASIIKTIKEQLSDKLFFTNESSWRNLPLEVDVDTNGNMLYIHFIAKVKREKNVVIVSTMVVVHFHLMNVSSKLKNEGKKHKKKSYHLIVFLIQGTLQMITPFYIFLTKHLLRLCCVASKAFHWF